MSEQQTLPIITYEEWKATDVAVRRLLLSWREVAALSEHLFKSLTRSESALNRTQEQTVQVRENVRRKLSSLRKEMEYILSDHKASLPDSAIEVLLALRQTASETEPFHHLLGAVSDHVGEADERLRLSARDLTISLRNIADAIEPLFTLLARLDEDLDQASHHYERLRADLIRKLKDWGSPMAPEHADEAINRVIRKIEMGTEVQNLANYCQGVAWKVMRERSHGPIESSTPSDEEYSFDPRKVVEEKEKEAAAQARWEERLACMRGCLKRLPFETRWLISNYADPSRQGADKIKHRVELAALLDVTLQALRSRIFKIRQELYNCVEACLKRQEGC